MNWWNLNLFPFLKPLGFGSILALALALSWVPVSLAGTWQVEQDGTGDFTIIQHAVDAAAPGDTILIGPGHYTERTSVQIPLWPQPTDIFVNITKENLTFIGSDVDQVVIGPDEYYSTFYGPQGFGGATLQEHLVVRNISIRNVRDGMYVKGGGDVENCKFYSMTGSGIASLGDVGMRIISCYFDRSPSGVGFLFNSGGEIRDCTFYKSSATFLDATGIIVFGSRFEGGWPGISFERSQGEVRNCSLDGRNLIEGGVGACGVIGIDGSDVIVSDSSVVSYGFAVRGVSGSTVNVTNSVLDGTWTIDVEQGSIFSLTNSDISKTGDWFVHCAYYSGEPLKLDFRGNYWGGASLAEIAVGIWDINDDPDLHYTIQVEPMSDVPLPAEKQSLDGFRSMFR